MLPSRQIGKEPRDDDQILAVLMTRRKRVSEQGVDSKAWLEWVRGKNREDTLKTASADNFQKEFCHREKERKK